MCAAWPGMSQAGCEPRAGAGSDVHKQRALFAVIGNRAWQTSPKTLWPVCPKLLWVTCPFSGRFGLRICGIGVGWWERSLKFLAAWFLWLGDGIPSPQSPAAVTVKWGDDAEEGKAAPPT